MKVFFDVVYTQRPSVCSTSYLVWELIEHLMKWRDDVFFYVTYPPSFWEFKEEREFLSRYPDRVTLIPFEACSSDRVSEIFMLRNSLRGLLNPWSARTWDTDVVVSSRMPVLKHMMVHTGRQMGQKLRSPRMFIGLEEMPVLPFRDTVSWSDVLYPDTLMTYALTDATLINNLWTKKALMPVLKEVLAASYQKKVLEKIHEVVPVKLQRLNLKKEMYQSGDFNVTFVGRITGTRNFTEVADLFRKQFSFPIGPHKADMKFLISTNSQTTGASDYGEIDFIDMQMNDRPKFYEFLKHAHVALNMSTVEDFSLTTYETLMAGVPVIVLDQPWNGFLGPSYPFRAKNFVEAYAMLSKFASSYAQEYAKFRLWEDTWWASFIAGPANVTTGEKLQELLTSFETYRAGAMKEMGHSYVNVLKGIPDTGGKVDLQKYLTEKGSLRWEMKENFSLALARTPSVLMLKFKAYEAGYKDTNATGVMAK